MIRNRFPEEVESRFTNEVQIQGHWEDMCRKTLNHDLSETTLLTNGVLQHFPLVVHAHKLEAFR
jgi:hypothetical protein